MSYLIRYQIQDRWLCTTPLGLVNMLKGVECYKLLGCKYFVEAL